MCGLVGIFQTRDRREVDRSVLHQMNESQWHRGPDEGGLHLEPGVGLGHRRLSIIDRADGQQPLFNEDESVVVVFNGEIYNFRELAKELAEAGHQFRTASDTEVIVHAWEQWGEACVERFRGMFAFAIWDRNRQTLFLARDRLGIKPLYYSLLENGELLFGSELKALKQHPGFNHSLDSRAIDEYFGFGYVPEPRSIYSHTSKLLPGHSLTLSYPVTRLPEQRQYWDVSFATVAQVDEKQALEQLREKLREAVDIRLVAEVPLGSFLSGGVDSSSVVATMASLSEDPVKTCSIAFGEAEFDESDHARQVAQRYRTDHSVDMVDTNDYSLLDKLTGLYDEPFADSSALPTYRVCELAKQHVTVVLSGDGGDEALAGYGRYARHLTDLQIKAGTPQPLRAMMGGIGKLYPDHIAIPAGLRKRQGLLAMAQDPVTAFFELNSVMKNDLRASLYSRSFREELQGYTADRVSHRYAENCATDDPLAMAQYLDLKTYLPGDILTKVDRASMAHALEVRVPLLDHKFIEWAATMPAGLKRHDGEGKWLLKKAMEPMLPHDILYRPKKGFAVPLRNWFMGPLRQQVESVMQSDVLYDRQVFERKALNMMWEKHKRGQQDFSSQIWSVLMFESFLRQEEHAA